MTPESDRPARPGGKSRRGPSKGDEDIESKLSAGLRQMKMDESHAMAEALTQAETILSELVERGRYARDAAAEDREADRLRFALALLRARRMGFEDGAAMYAWWRESVSRGDSSFRQTRPP